jgi:polyvinyl alcohol dehydrogenase (cytochrome)
MIRKRRVWRISMMAFRSRHTKTISVLARALCAAGAVSSWAQDAAIVPLNGGKCPTAGTPVVDALSTPHWNGWGVDASQHRFQPSEMAQLAADDVPRLKLKWAFGYPAAIIAFAQPTIVAGRLFVGSQSAKV